MMIASLNRLLHRVRYRLRLSLLTVGFPSRRLLVILVAVVSFGFGMFLGVRNEPGPGLMPVSAVTLPRDGPETVRGLYVVRHSLSNATSIDRVIEQAVQIGANTLFVQVNGRSEAYYSSDFIVAAPGVAPGFDPLAYVLERAHSVGLSVHAWINAYTAGMLLENPVHPDHILNQRPDWVTVDRTGRSLWDYDWREAQVHVPARMLDPGVPAVGQFVLLSVMDVVEKYDVDGVHIDYIRYPSRRFGFHPESIRLFEAAHGFDPLALEREAPAFVANYGRPEFEHRIALWDEWRRQQVTALVRELRQGVKAHRPEIVFSVAVISDAEVAVAERLQDWPAWIAAGLVDAVVPMAYNPNGELVAEQIRTAADFAVSVDVPIFAGIGAYMLTDRPAALARQIEAALAAGASGTVIFSHDTILQDRAVAGALIQSWQIHMCCQ